MKTATILNRHFRRVGEAGLDDRKRISLTKPLEFLKEKLGDQLEAEVRFGVYVNDAGQVLLSPEVSVPMHEVWLYQNPKALKSVLKGLRQSREGKLVDLGSFAKYADEEID
jgi:hypothetical protein